MENVVAGYPAQLAPHLELRRVLGEGGSSVVFEAFHTRLKVPVAVKLMSVRGAMAQQARARLVREAELYALLDDPRVPRVYDVDELPDGTPFVVMEFVPGQSLETLLLSGPLSPRRALGIAQEVLAALAYVHSRGVLHRDVKPANVILCESDGKCQVRLVDFGIAKVSDHADQTLTQQGTIVGTPHYMAPERLLGQEAAERADIYSVGVMLYEMLAGAVPFGGPTLGEVIASVLRDDPAPLRSRAPHVSQELERVVQRAMQRSGYLRYASAEEMKTALSALETAFQGEASSPRIVSPTRAQALPSVPPRRQPLASLDLDAEDYRPPRRRVEKTPLYLLAVAGAIGLWAMWPSNVADLRVQLEPSSAEPASAPEPTPPLNLEPPPAPALAASPEELVEGPLAAPSMAPSEVGADPSAAGVDPSADGVADRLSGQFAQALGAGGLGEVIGQVGAGAPGAAQPAEALAGGAAPEAAPGSESLARTGAAARPPVSASPAAQQSRVPRARSDDDPYEDEDYEPAGSAGAAAGYAPAKSVPLQPLLDQLDKLLKEPPPPPPREPEETRPRRSGKVDLPANPY